jgi:hypothetical protein
VQQIQVRSIVKSAELPPAGRHPAVIVTAVLGLTFVMIALASALGGTPVLP